MSQDPVIAEVDALSEDVDTGHHDDQASPGEQPWDDRRQGQQVDQTDRNGVGPHNLSRGRWCQGVPAEETSGKLQLVWSGEVRP